MTTPLRDPLLAIARIMLALAMGVLAFATGAIALAVPAVIVMRSKVLEHISVAGTPPEAIWAIVMLMVSAAVAAFLGFLFFRHLSRIVASVGDGDPFVPVNATRLQAMGWIAVAVQILGIPVVAVSRWIDRVTEHVDATAHLSLSGILLAVILFVLARVFREGARMRDELEGTV